MLHNERAEKRKKKKITCADPVLGVSLQTPGGPSPPLRKHLLQKPYATACLHVAAPAGHCCSASLGAQALPFPTPSAAGSGCSIDFAGCPSAGSPAHQSFAQSLAAPRSSSCPLRVCSVGAVKRHRLFLLGSDLQTLSAVAADPGSSLCESGSRRPAAAGLLCQNRAGAPGG